MSLSAAIVDPSLCYLEQEKKRGRRFFSSSSSLVLKIGPSPDGHSLSQLVHCIYVYIDAHRRRPLSGQAIGARQCPLVLV